MHKKFKKRQSGKHTKTMKNLYQSKRISIIKDLRLKLLQTGSRKFWSLERSPNGLDKVPQESTRTLGGRIISLSHTVGQMAENLHAKNQLDLSNRFDIIPACDRQTAYSALA